MSFETAQAQHDRQEPPTYNEAICGKCREEYGDHWFTTISGKVMVFCEQIDFNDLDQRFDVDIFAGG